MATHRIISAVFDTATTARKVIVGESLAEPDAAQKMNLYYGTQIVFRATLLSGAVDVAYNPAAGSAWIFGFDNTFVSGHPDLVVSDNTQFNISGDWDELNPDAGKICWRANLATTELKTALDALAANTQSQIMYAYLWMCPPGGGYVLIAVWPVYVYRIAVDPVTATATTPIGGMTPAQAAASFVPIWGDQARWRWRAGGWQYLFEEDSQWRALTPRIIEGHPTIAWSDPVSP